MSTKRVPPPPKCFSCGNEIPESDYETFFEKCENGVEKHLQLDVMGYYLNCCRRMLLGDCPEHRRIMALYDNDSEINPQIIWG